MTKTNFDSAPTNLECGLPGLMTKNDSVKPSSGIM